MAKILILTQYYPPETGAPQNRLSSLARYLKQDGHQVTVLTAMPNYPQMSIYEHYRRKLYQKDTIDGITVHRAWIYASRNKKIFPRLVNYFSFVFSSAIVGLLKIAKQDIIICESPPLFLGFSGLFLRMVKQAKLVFNVSDLWPETAEELGIITNRTLLKLSTRFEEYVYRKSALISGQTQGIIDNISKRIPDKQTYLFRNGADLDRFNNAIIDNCWRKKNGFSENDFIVLYGGIVGYAQNLEVILRAAKQLKHIPDIKFVILGEGPSKENLLSIKVQLDLYNVSFFSAVPSAEMASIINACNAGVIPLRNIPLFKGAIPSKIFEYLALGKPILLGIEGEAKQLFIEDGNCGLFFTPQNHEKLATAILKFKNHPALASELGENGRKYVTCKFDRRKLGIHFSTKLRELSSI